MAFEENGERIDDLKMIAQKVSEVATLFDDDGILVRFMNSPVEGNSIRCGGWVGVFVCAGRNRRRWQETCGWCTLHVCCFNCVVSCVCLCCLQVSC
jgi:hypothetical protein